MTQKFEDSAVQDNASEVLSNLSSQDFLSFGMENLAYIRPVVVDGRQAYAVHAANGIPITVTENFESAMGSIAEQDMQANTLQ